MELLVLEGKDKANYFKSSFCSVIANVNSRWQCCSCLWGKWPLELFRQLVWLNVQSIGLEIIILYPTANRGICLHVS